MPGDLGGVGGGLGGAIGNVAILAGAAGKGGAKSYKAALDVWKKLQDPNFDMRSLSAPELQVVGQYFPQVYNAIVPQQAQTISEDPATRAAQMGSLEHLQQYQNTDLPLSEKIAAQNAQASVQDASRRAQQSVMSELAQRGRLGAGDEIQARQGANQQAANLAHGLGSDLTQQSIQARLQANQGAGQLAGQIRGQDLGAVAQNAEIMNRFNEMVANQRNSAAQYGAAARERSQAANIGNAQDVSNQNALNSYNVASQNLNRQNALRGDLFNSQLARTQGTANAYNQYGLAQDAQQAAKAAAIRGIGQGVGQVAGGGLGFL